VSASQIHTLFSEELYQKLFIKCAQKWKKIVPNGCPLSGKALRPPSGKNVQMAEATNSDQVDPSLNFDYTNLIVSNLQKKKQIRKVMITEYMKEYKFNTLQDISPNEKLRRMTDYKVYNELKQV
jgi:hypothetical protein